MPGDVDRADLLEPEVPLASRDRGRARRSRRSPRPRAAAPRAPCSFRPTSRSLIPTMSSAWPVNVVPSTAATPMVFSSTNGSTSSGPIVYLSRLQRDDPRLDVEVAAELLPHHVHVAAENQVRPGGVLARRLAARAPLPLQRERAQHDRLRGALRPRTGRLAGGVEEVGEHADAALLDLGRLRVLGVVDEVAVEVLGDHPLRLGLHPGGHEGRQVARGNPVEDQVLVDQPHGVNGGHAVLRQLVIGRVLQKEAIAEPAGERVEMLDGHRNEASRGRPRPGKDASTPFPCRADLKRAVAGWSNACITPPIAKQSAPVSVPQLATSTLISLEVSGLMNAASAETMKRMEPSWLIATIHQPRSRHRTQGRKRPQNPLIARWPEIRKNDAADHLGAPDQPVLLLRRQPVQKRIEQADAECQRADEQHERAQPIEPVRLVGPPAPAFRRSSAALIARSSEA